MSSDSEDEDFVEYGTALDSLDEGELPRKKPFSLNDQVATDKYGRRRFHGAFTGGFSAGFFNSVGSLEGWTPTTFKSSRGDKAKEMQQKPEDYMDEEDMDVFGIAPKVLRATSDFNEGSKKRSRMHQLSDGPIPGEPVLRKLLQPVRETVGMKLLRKMGWKPEQGTGPRLTKSEKRKMREEHKKTGVKVYGCALPQEALNEDSPCSTDDEDDAQLSFAPDDLAPFLCKPKNNSFGLGYSGLDRRPVLSRHIDLFTPTPLRMEEKKKKLLISGQAFGVGAFEDDDEDIYGREDMSQYDFSLDTETASSKQKCQVTETTFANYAGNILMGFILGTNAMSRKKQFPPPALPQGFEPVHVPRKSRFEPAPTEKASLSKGKELLKSRKKGTECHNLSATDRALILSESTPRLPVHKDNTISTTHKENKRSPTEELKTKRTLEISVQGGYSQFRPFVANPEKQKRYEQYLTLSKIGQTDQLSYIQPLTMTEWEKERERVEFMQAARLYQPLTGIMSDRFVSASRPEDLSNPLPSASEDVDTDCEQRAAAKLKMFGRLTRQESDWRPCSLLCKRFNVPELCPGGDELTAATQKTASNFSVFSFLDAASYNRAVKTADSSDKPIDEMKSVSEFPEVTIKQEPDAESNTHNSVSLEQTSDNSLLEFPDPPEKIDLYKAIFLSSSEDSDNDGEEEDSENLTKENKPKQNVLQEELEAEEKTISSDKFLTSAEKNTQRNMSPPRGLFANLDLDAINARKEKSNKVPEKKEESENKQTTNEQNDTLEQPVQDMYGPQLPSISTPSATNSISLPIAKKVIPSVVTSVHNEWVEKTKDDSHRSKHTKKHKKSSKHKKHKHKTKRH